MKRRHLLLVFFLLLSLAFPLSGFSSSGGSDVTALLTNLTAEVKQNGFPVPEGGILTSDPVNVVFSFGIPVEGDEPAPATPVRRGDFAEFELGSGFVLNSSTSYELKDGDTLIGHVSIRTETDLSGVKHVIAQIVFDGDEAVYNGESFAVSAFFIADLAFDASGSSGGTGEYPVSILNKGYTVIIPPGEILYSLDKSGTVDFENRTLTWTVVLDGVQDGSPVDLSGYRFEDDLSDAGSYIPDSFSVSGVAPNPDPDITATGLSYTLLAGTAGPKTITYKTLIPDDQYFSNSQQTARNDARLLDSAGTPVKFDSAELTFNPEWISKSGQAGDEGTPAEYNAEDRTITWTIEANQRALALDDVVITDTLPAGLTWQEAYWQAWDGTDWVTQGSFAAEPAGSRYLIGDISTRVRLVIVAGVPDEEYVAAVTTYNNAASIWWNGTGVPAEGIGTSGVGPVGVGFDAIIKSGSANVAAGTISWTVGVDVREQNIPDLKVYDLLVYGTAWDAGSVSGGPGGFALGSLTPRFNQRYVGGFSGSAGLSEQVFTLTQGGVPVADLLEVSGLSTTMANSFSFTSKVVNPGLFAGNERITVQNTAALFSDTLKLNEATGSVDYNGMALKKSMLHRDAAVSPLSGANPNTVTSDLASGFNFQDKSVVFRLNVNVNGMDFSGSVDENGNTPGTVTLTDALPAGWEYAEVVPGEDYVLLEGIGVSPSGEILTGSSPSPVAPAGFSASVAGGTAAFTFDSLSSRYVILLRARPTDAAAAVLFNENKTTVVDNTVTMVTENWPGYTVSSTQRVNVVSNLLGKSAVRPSNGELLWTLEYRPYGIDDLVSPPAYIADRIPQGVELRTDASGALILSGNISASELTLRSDGSYLTGASITLTVGGNISYDNATRILRFDIPDSGIGYRLSYITDITGEPGDRVTNEATLYGKSDTPTGVAVSFLISQQDAGASLNKGGRLQITKAGGLGRPLSGVEYTLFASDNVTPIRTGTTGSDGLLNMRVIPVGSYILRETAVPAVYLLDSTEHAVSVSNVSGTIVTSINGKTGEDSNQLLVRNITAVNADVSASKTWVGGFAVDHTGIELTLYANGQPIDNVIIPPVITPPSGGEAVYTYTWPSLPVSDESGPIVYTVDEAVVPVNYAKELDQSALDVTNSYRIIASKTWEDGRYAAKGDLWFKLYRQAGPSGTPEEFGAEVKQLPAPVYSGIETSKTVQVEWLGLDAEDALGTDYIFTVREGTYDGTTFTEAVPANFSAEPNGLSVTNSYEIPTRETEVVATKEWVGLQNPRPTVWFRLERRTTAGPWGAAGNWTDFSLGLLNMELPDGVTSVAFTDLDATDLEGRTYEFRVREVNASNVLFTPLNYSKTESGLTVTNRYTINAQKIWVNGNTLIPRPTVWFKLYRNILGGPVMEVPEAGVLALPNGTTSVNWQGMDAEDEDGNDYIYTVKEGVLVSGSFMEMIPQNYAVTYNGLQVTNSYVIPTDASATATKTWVYGTTTRPTVWFKLYRNILGGAVLEVPGAEVRELTAGTTAVQWTSLERTDIQGNPYSFTVIEGSYNSSTGVFTAGAPENYTVTYQGLNVTNTYRASGSVQLQASKALDLGAGSRTAEPGEFTFQLRRSGSVLDTQTNDADGNVVFAPITYTEADIGREYSYTIVELVPSSTEAGMTYDSLVAAVTVTVEDSGNGVLTATPDYLTGTVFRNSYKAAGDTILTAVKSLDLEAGTRTVKPGEFSFNLYEGNGTTGTLLQTKMNAADGTVTFDAIPYDQTSIGSTYAYTISEAQNTETGIISDPMEIVVNVAVTDQGNGSLLATPTYPQDTVFNNRYEADGGAILAVSKSLELGAGSRKVTADEFSFNLYEGSGTAGTLLQTKMNAADGTVIFDAIPYDQTSIGSIYTYTITEVPGAESGMSYDPITVEVTVEVTDEGNGVLKAIPAYPLITEFENTYKATGEIELTAKKDLSGRTLAEGEFSFELWQLTGPAGSRIGTAPMQTALNKLDGAIDFLAIPYTQEDIGETYYYEIVELVPSMPLGGVTYDTELRVEYSVSVSDAGAGILSITRSEPEDKEFNNIYKASGEFDIQVELDPNKSLTGRELKDQEFSFELKQGDTVIETMKNGPDGIFLFSSIPYTRDDIGKTYTYTISEVPGTEPGMYYDDLVITFEVTITDNLDGTLKVISSTPDDTEFNNIFTAPTPNPRPDYPTISVPFAVRKILAGRQMSEGEFNFILKDAAGNVIDRASNNSQGDIVFQSRQFSRTGLFLYTVEEVKGDDKQITYDGTSFTIKVNVTASNGRLIVRIDYLKDGTPFGGEIAFQNTYLPPQTGDSQPNLIILISSAALLTMLLAFGIGRGKQPRTKNSKKPSM